MLRETAFRSKRDVHYSIFDPMLAFYYRFIRDKAEWIKSGAGKAIKTENEAAIKNFLDHAFEKLCLTYLDYLNKKGRLATFYPQFENISIGQSQLGRSIEIGVVAAEGSHLLIGESKFSQKERTYRDYSDMLEDVSVPPFSAYGNVEFYLFGANGFSDSLREVEDPRLHLIGLDTMLG